LADDIRGRIPEHQQACVVAFWGQLPRRNQSAGEISDIRHKGQEVMTKRTIPGRGGSGSAQRISRGPARLRILLALPAVVAAAAALVACSSAGASSGSSTSSTTSPAVAAAGTVKTATIAGVTVLTNSKGFTLYSFAPDTSTTSKCNGTCAQNWPPVTGPVTGSGVTGTFGTIKRSDGSVQATFDGHPLYTFAGDTAPGQAKGNGLNAAGGLWHEITTSGTAAPAGGASSGSGGSGY
jgi:predicted lipoprotein with Yx(FWY)xxD motif